MRLKDAIEQAKALAGSSTAGLSPRDRVALHVLIQMAKRVERLQKPLRQLHRALCPEEEMNQTELFGGD